jgi:tetratricopeptide (TPR) repeat protein
MIRIGKHHFANWAEYEDRILEINLKELIRPEIKAFLSGNLNEEIKKYLNLSYESYKNEEYSMAVEYYTKVIELDPTDITAIFFRGASNIKLGKFNETVNDMTQLINIRPDIIQAYFYRANARVSINTYTQLMEAILDYSIVINENENDGIAHFLRGYCYFLLKKEDDALLDWKAAKKLGVSKQKEKIWKLEYSSRL